MAMYILAIEKIMFEESIKIFNAIEIGFKQTSAEDKDVTAGQ